MPAINLADDRGESIVLNGVAYRRVGQEQVAADTSWPVPAPGEHQLYNVSATNFSVADVNGKRTWTEEEMSIALLPEYHNRNFPVTVTNAARVVLYTAPVDGIIRTFKRESFCRSTAWVGGIEVWTNTEMARLALSPSTDDGDMSNYDFATCSPFKMEAGEEFEIILTEACSHSYHYMFLPFVYPPVVGP